MKTNNSKFILLLLVVIAIMGGTGIWYLSNKSLQVKEQEYSTANDNEEIMTVGQETIYGRDLNYELSYYPQEGQERKAIVLQKLANDSIILQGGQEERIISLDNSVYNSLEKDYGKRLEMVEVVKKAIQEKGDSMSGNVIGLWFYNNGWVGPAGLEKGKEEAFEKLSKLRDQVANGSLTMQQAGEIIKNDASNADLDRAYQNNAIFEFKAMKGQKNWITRSQDLDEELWSLTPGKVSQLYIGTGLDEDTGEPYEALYLFGMVTEKAAGESEYIPFEDWLNEKKEIYKIEYH
jgi:hypothetical protein